MKPPLRHPFLLLLVLLLAASPALVAQEEAPAPAPAEKPSALALVDEIMKEVEEARGLEFKEEFARKILSPAEVSEFARKKLEEEFPPEKIEGMTRLYARLGFFPPDLDIAETIGRFLEAGAGGLYDPAEKTLVLVEGFSGDGARPVLFHELVHALEDQHFDLEKLMEAFQEESDPASGVQAVVEGSAQFLTDRYLAARPELLKAMTRDMMARMGEQVKMLQSVPMVLFVGAGLYPYTTAPAFVAKATEGDPARIGELYASLPASTEQVLHPEKYGPGGDLPYRIVLSDLSGVLPEGWEGPFEDVIGELQVAILLNEFRGGAPLVKLMRVMTIDGKLHFQRGTKTASEGWDGDRAASWKGADGEIGLVWASRWDSSADAEEFAAAYGKGREYKEGILGLGMEGARVEVRGDRVLVVEGFPAGLAAKVAAAAWAGTKFVADEPDGPEGGAK